MENKLKGVGFLQILLDISIHLILTLIFSLIIYLKSGNPGYIIIFIFGGILVDLDHFIDYFIYFKNKFNLIDFFKHTYLKSGRVYLILHSWEINLIILVLGLIMKSAELQILSLSLTIHYTIDNLQRKNLLMYFLVYRIIKKFDVKILLPEVNIT